MEIKVGVVENESLYAKELVELLYKWSVVHNCEILHKIYSSGEELLAESDINFDIFFIDIQLASINGVDTAKKLRGRNYKGGIVFLTAFKEYVFQGYEVNAINYILKPIKIEKLELCMAIILKDLKNENYILRNRDLVERIPYNEIIYILSSRHHMELVTNCDTYRHWISMKNILKILPSQFIQCHRTVIVNIDHVKKLQGKTINMSNNICLPVSNTYIQNVRNQIQNSVF